jgi:hypothetical protein
MAMIDAEIRSNGKIDLSAPRCFAGWCNNWIDDS